MRKPLVMTIDGQKVPVNWSLDRLPTPQEGEEIEMAWRARQKPAKSSVDWGAALQSRTASPSGGFSVPAAAPDPNLQRRAAKSLEDAKDFVRPVTQHLDPIVAKLQQFGVLPGGPATLPGLPTPKTENATGFVGGLVNWPNEMAAEAGTALAPGTPLGQRAGAVGNLALNFLGPELLIGKGAVWNAARELSLSQKLAKKAGIPMAEARQAVREARAFVGGDITPPVKGLATKAAEKKPVVKTPIRQVSTVSRTPLKARPSPGMQAIEKEMWEAEAKAGKPIPEHIQKKYPGLAQPTLKVEQGGFPSKAAVDSEMETAWKRTQELQRQNLRKTVAPVTPPSGTSGLARQFEDKERVAAGKALQPKQHTPAVTLAEEGRRSVETGAVKPQDVLDRVLVKGERPNYQDASVIAYHKAKLRDEKGLLLKEKPSPERDARLILLDKETERVDQFAQKARPEFHQMGEALQIAYGDDMAFASLRDEARALNFHENLKPNIEKQLKSLSDKHEVAQAEIAKLKAQLGSQLKTQRVAVSNPARLRVNALNRLQNLGIETAKVPKTGGLPSKKSGAISPPPMGKPDAQVSAAIRDLTNSYIREGVTDIDEILKRVAADVPGMHELDIMSALSPQVKKYRTDAMVAATQARRVMNKVRQTAEFRTKTTLDKAITVGIDVAKNLKRTVQASFDVSAAMLQGKPALLARPGSWLKSWEATAKALSARPLATTEVQDRLWAELLSDPTIREAHEQGWLNLRSPGAAFSPQEEIFRGNIAHYIPGVARSDSMFASQLNSMYGDWYRKLAAFAPDNPEYKRSIGAMLNIFSGRGHGKIADMLGNEHMGWFGYAPKYAYSLAQMGTGAPLWMKTMHPLARLQAAKAYVGMIASIFVINKAAKAFGWEVNNDPRSVDFGMLKSPDGRQVDAYNKITQVPRLLTQVFYGKVGARGQYKEPGQWGFEPLTDYMHSNFSPALRDLEMISTGKMWDAGEGKMRDVTKADIAWSWAPLAVQDLRTMKNRDTANIILGFTGARPKQAETRGLKRGEKRAPGFNPAPVGVRRIFGG